MKKKIMAIIAIMAIIMANTAPVMAAEYNTDGTAECEVSARVTSTYTVSIPAEISLTYDPESGTVSGGYEIGAKGSLLLNQMLQVTPIQLTKNLGKGLNGEYHYGELKGKHTDNTLLVTVTQQIIRWIPAGTEPQRDAESCIEISEDEYVYSEGYIESYELEEPDDYFGTLVFQFGLEEYDRKQ